MALMWISINSTLESGISFINALSTEQFEMIINNIHQIKSVDFLTKLQENLQVSEDKLKYILQSIAYIHKQSSKVILKPTDLKKQLSENLHLDKDKADAFLKLWAEEVRSIKLESKKKVQNISWELNFQSASSHFNQQAIPSVRLQMGLGTNDTVTFELDEEELLQLYDTLETIQIKLDCT